MLSSSVVTDKPVFVLITVVKELRSKMFGQHPGYLKAVFLKQTNQPEKFFITENLTKYRTELVKQLAELKYNGLLYTYWTSDGRIFIKQNTTSRKLLINNRDDILDFIHSTKHGTST